MQTLQNEFTFSIRRYFFKLLSMSVLLSCPSMVYVQMFQSLKTMKHLVFAWSKNHQTMSQVNDHSLISPAFAKTKGLISLVKGSILYFH